MKFNCTNHLSQEHKRILRAIYVLEAMAERARTGRIPEAGDVEKLLNFFKGFADEHHQGKEESVLFPAFNRASDAVTAAPLRHMMFEHEQERSLVSGLEDSLRTRRNTEFAYYAGRLADQLSNHIYKEENILFDLVERTISPETDGVLTLEMIACDEALTSGKYDAFVQIVNDLEWKYLGKAA